MMTIWPPAPPSLPAPARHFRRHRSENRRRRACLHRGPGAGQREGGCDETDEENSMELHDR